MTVITSWTLNAQFEVNQVSRVVNIAVWTAEIALRMLVAYNERGSETEFDDISPERITAEQSYRHNTINR